MGSTETTYGSTEESGDEYGGTAAMAASYARKLGPRLQEHSRSGTMTGIAGGLSVLRAVRMFRRGRTGRALLQLLFGLVWIGIAATQRRERREGGGAGGVDQSDVVSTAPDDLAAATTDDAGIEHHENVDGVDTGTDDLAAAATDDGNDLGEADVDEREVVDTGTDAADAAEESDEGGDASEADADVETEAEAGEEDEE